MKSILLVIVLCIGTGSIAQEGVELNSMNSDATKVIHTSNSQVGFRFGESFDHKILKWEMHFYDGSYKEFLFKIDICDVQDSKTVYYVTSVGDEKERTLTFFYSNSKMVLIEEVGVAPLVLTGDLEY